MTISIADIESALNRLCAHAATTGTSDLRTDADLISVAASAISAAIRASWALRHHGIWELDETYEGWWNVRVSVSDDTETDAGHVIATIAKPTSLW